MEHDTNEQMSVERYRRDLLRGAGGVAALTLAGCQEMVGLGGEGGSAGKLTFAQAKSPIEFDPIVLNDVPSQEIVDQIFQGPYTFDRNLGLKPDLANDQPTVENSGKRWIIPLRSDATFHNGDKVTAEDVIYSYRAPLEEETENAAEVNMIEDASAVDEETVQFDLEYQFAPFKSYLTRSVVPKSVREEDKEAFNKENPVGSGPFEFGSFTEGESTTITRWGDYWGDPTPNLGEIEFVPVEESTTRITTLKDGSNDVIKDIPPQSWQSVKGMGDASVESVPGVGYFYLAFNCNEGPTTDPKVREAIDYAVSMDDAVQRFVEPTGVRQYGPIPADLAEAWNFPTDEWQQIPHEKNVDEAKSILDGSDAVPDDWSAKIIVPPDDKRENIGVSVANGIKEAGYDATVQRLDWPKFTSRYNTGKASDYNMYTLGWAGTPDPDSFMYFLFSHETIGTNNGSYYENEEMNQAILGARKTLDHDERRQHYVSAIDTVLNDRVHLPAYNLKNSYGVRNRVNDFTPHPIDNAPIVDGQHNVTVQ